MAVLDILTAPDPRLKVKAQGVKDIGLAAPLLLRGFPRYM